VTKHPKHTDGPEMDQPIPDATIEWLDTLCKHSVQTLRRTGETAGVVAELVCTSCGTVVEQVTLRAWRRQGSVNDRRHSTR
jgi:hypothetical protein